MINQKNNDEKCFKWAVIAALHHEDIKRISLLQHDEDQCNWNGFESPLVIQQLGKFEMNNPGIAVNMLFIIKNSKHAVCRSKLNTKRSKQANLLMIVDGERRHYTVIKNISRLLSKQNGRSNSHITHITLGYGDVPDPLKIYCDKNCVLKFIEHIEGEVKLVSNISKATNDRAY